MEPNHLIYISVMVLMLPFAFIEPQIRICTKYERTIAFRKKAMKIAMRKKVKFSRVKLFKATYDKMCLGGSRTLTAFGIGFSQSFEFSQMTQAKEGSNEANCKYDLLKTEFQEGTLQIYKETKQKWMIGSYTGDHSVEEYVDTQLQGYACNYDKYKLKAMANESLRAETEGGPGIIDGDTYKEETCVKICKFILTKLFAHTVKRIKVYIYKS